MANALKEREETGVTPEGAATDDRFNEIMGHDDNSDLRAALGGKEESPTTTDAANEDAFGYLKNQGLMSDTPPKRGGFFGRHKGGIAGGGIILFTVGGFFGLAAPLKLQGMLSMLENAGMTRIEGYIEKRAKKIIIQSLMERFGVDAVKNGERQVVADRSIIKSIAKTMTASKYEERLAAKGLEFTSKDGQMSVRVVGDNSDAAKKLLGKAFKNADELEKALDGIPISKQIMKSIVKEDLGVWGFLVRGKLVKWMMKYLGINKFGTSETDKNASPEDKAKATATDDLVDATEAQAKSIDEAFNVMDNPDKLGQEAGEAASDTAKTASKEALKNAAEEAAHEAEQAIDGTASKAITKVVVEIGEKVGTETVKKLGSKIGSKAIPIYGEVTLAATAVVFANWAIKHSKDGKLYRALALPAAMLMAFSFAKWSGIATQSKLGSLDTDLYNYYVPFFDGAEASSLFNCVSKDWQTGCDQQGEPAYKKINEKTPALAQQIANIAGTFGFVVDDKSPVYWLGRIIYFLDDKLTGLVMEGVMKVVETQFNIATLPARLMMNDEQKAQMKQGFEGLMQKMSEFAFNMLINVFGLAISPMMGGNKLNDILLNGSVYTANRFAESSLGLQEIDIQTATRQTQEYLAEQRQYEKGKGLVYALFSPDTNSSVTSQLVSNMSFGGGSTNTLFNAFASLGNLLKRTPSNLAGLFSASLSAASYSSPEAILDAQAFGMSDSEADSPVNDKVLSGDPCKSSTFWDGVTSFFAVESNEPFSTCAIDKAAADSINCSIDASLTENSPECNPDLFTGGSPGSIPTISGLPDGGVKDTTEGRQQAWAIAEQFIQDLNKIRKGGPGYPFPDIKDYTLGYNEAAGTPGPSATGGPCFPGASNCDQCYALSAWFLDKYTKQQIGTVTSSGDGVVAYLKSKGVPTGDVAQVYSVFSYGRVVSGDSRAGAHTGVVVGIDGDYAITVENNFGPHGGELIIKKRPKDGAKFRGTGDPTVFAYVNGIFKDTPKTY